LIRPAEIKEVGKLVKMGIQFHSASEMDEFYPLDENHLAANLRRMIRAPNSRVLVLDLDGSLHGVVGFVVVPNYFSPRARTAHEQFYWINPDKRGQYGKQLLIEMEEEAAAMGCTHSTMVSLEALDPDRVGKLYRGMGYQPLEHVHIKRL
jgi:GNAT superfamily N-acetyltransferase